MTGDMKPEEKAKINDTKIEVKKIPFKCPVCGGFGTLMYGKKICHGCNGTGFIVVSQEEVEK